MSRNKRVRAAGLWIDDRGGGNADIRNMTIQPAHCNHLYKTHKFAFITGGL